MTDLPDILIEALARRRCILYLGAGTSKNAASNSGKRPPDWKEFLEFALKDLNASVSIKKNIRALINQGDYLTACQILKSKLDENWPRVLNKLFSEPGFRAQNLHKSIFEIDCPLVLTTNFDNIYETLARTMSDGQTIIKQYNAEDLAQVARGDTKSRAVLKLHGSLDDVPNMIFTKEDYAKQRQKHSIFFHLVEALLCTQTFLFVGCGLNDPDLMLLLENYSQAHTKMAPHYALMAKGIHKDIREVYRKNYNLKLLEYSPDNNHQELEKIMSSLKEGVNARREEMCKSGLW